MGSGQRVISYRFRSRSAWANGVSLAGEADLRAASVPFDLTSESDDFEATVWTNYTGLVLYSHWVGTAVSSARRAEHLNDIFGPQIRLTFPLSGSGLEMRQGPDICRVRAGEAAAIRFDEPFTSRPLHPDRHFDIVEVFIPRRHLHVCGVDPAAISGHSWPLSELSQACVRFLTEALHHCADLPATQAAWVDGAAIRSAMLIINDGLPPRDASETADQELRRAVLMVVEAQSTNPRLSPEWIATTLHVSTRSVFRAFEGTGTSVANLIREYRLHGVARELERGDSDVTIATIAREFGFGGPDQLTRAFRRQFGTNPTEYRRRRRDR
ncbi:helix-turn-helix domain-containing protein [Gordonia sp. NPDC003429]